MVCKNCSKEFDIYRNVFCSAECSAQYRKKQGNERRLKLFREGKLVYRYVIYEYLVSEHGNKCNVCSISDWNGKPIRLWVDHIDGDASNNTPNNFRLICPNCESQTPTSRGRNYGKGRKSKGLPPYG